MHILRRVGPAGGAGIAVSLVLAAVALALWAPGGEGTVRADGAGSSAACTAAPGFANGTNGGETAFVDLGAGAQASFVCVASTVFSGGHSAQITANGTYANGCVFVQGIGTAIVTVFRERADIRPDCASIDHIDVGSGAVATVTPTTTTTTATPATATPTRTATQVPTATAAPAQPTATPTRTAVAPAPPQTGSGNDGNGGNAPLMAFGGLAAIAVAGILIATGWRRNRLSPAATNNEKDQ